MGFGLRAVRSILLLLLLGCAALCGSSSAQSASEAVPTAQGIREAGERVADTALADRPLPEIPALMHAVEENQRKAEAIEKDYIYHSVSTAQEIDGKGRVKKTTVTEADHFWINGVAVRRLLKKDGKELTPAELAKENERIDKEAAKGAQRREKAESKGKETDSNGNAEITVSRWLELGTFSNPRRLLLKGRSTIAVDFAGDPKAKTRTSSESLVRQLAGTVWVDEQDHALARVEGHFVNAFKLGAGLLVDVKKDTRFTYEQIKVNDEIWLPARIEGEGSARVMLFVSFSGKVQAVDSEYRKFRASSRILPGIAAVPSEEEADKPGMAQP